MIITYWGENLKSTWSTIFHPLLGEKFWWTLVH